MTERLPWAVLLVLLCVQGALVALAPPEPLHGDEPYYVTKARYLVEHRSLPRATPENLAAEAGGPGNSDWRPQGYPLFVALVSGGNLEPVTLRRRVAMAQFALIAAAVLIAARLIFPTLSFKRRLLAALILGIAPWPYAFTTFIGADSVNASLSFFGLALLWRWMNTGRLLFAGALVMATTLLFRPEMIVVAPVPIAVALLLRRATIRHWLTAAAAMVIVVGAQYAYRTYFIGRASLTLFGGLHIYNRGAFAWANSWLGTEHEAYDFVYDLHSRPSTRPLPARAFASDEERRFVEELRARATREGFSAEIDGEFAKLAAKRKREHPITAVVLPRLWHAVHVWVNTETSDQLLPALAPWPRPVRRGFLGALLVLKLALLAAFAWNAIRGRRDGLVVLMTSFVLARTLFVGLVLNWMVYRYLVSAWLPLLVVALRRPSPR